MRSPGSKADKISYTVRQIDIIFNELVRKMGIGPFKFFVEIHLENVSGTNCKREKWLAWSCLGTWHRLVISSPSDDGFPLLLLAVFSLAWYKCLYLCMWICQCCSCHIITLYLSICFFACLFKVAVCTTHGCTMSDVRAAKTHAAGECC